jgi:hypothetical protein
MQAVSHPADRKLGGMAQAIHDIQEPEVGAVFNVGGTRGGPSDFCNKISLSVSIGGDELVIVTS